MIYIEDFRRGAAVYEALDSDVRLGILDELSEKVELNLAYFAKRFNVSNGAITAHVKKLFAAGLIEIETSSGTRGTQKICRLATDRIVIGIDGGARSDGRAVSAKIPVGSYVDYAVQPVCGLWTREKPIGGTDDPSCFSYPERVRAGLLRLGGSGFVEYLLPNYQADGPLAQLEISAEIGSDEPSDVCFAVNGRTVARFFAKGDCADRAGACNPSQGHGKRVKIAVKEDGTYLGGVRASETALADLDLEKGKQIRLRIFVPEDAERRGGFTLFGGGFGDYGEDVAVNYIFQSRGDA